MRKSSDLASQKIPWVPCLCRNAWQMNLRQFCRSGAGFPPRLTNRVNRSGSDLCCVQPQHRASHERHFQTQHRNLCRTCVSYEDSNHPHRRSVQTIVHLTREERRGNTQLTSPRRLRWIEDNLIRSRAGFIIIIGHLWGLRCQ